MRKEKLQEIIDLNGKGCSKEYFDKKIASVICALKDPYEDFICIDVASPVIKMVQTTIRPDGHYRVEISTKVVWEEDADFVACNKYDRSQILKLFYEVCVLQKELKDITDYGLYWFDIYKEIAYCNILNELESKVMTKDEEAIYIETLIKLHDECDSNGALSSLSKYYSKIGDDELSARYFSLIDPSDVKAVENYNRIVDCDDA